MVISVIISLAIIGALLTFADLGKVANLIAGLQPSFLLLGVLVILLYNAIQAILWSYLLDHLGIDAPSRDRLLAFAFGNLTKYLPGGSYFQNYMLFEACGVDPALSSVATTLIVLMEPAIALLFLLIIGIDGWHWLRWAIGIGLPLALLFAVSLYLFIESPNLPRWLTSRGPLKTFAGEVINFRKGLATSADPRILSGTAALTAAYVLLEGLTLYLTARALHIDMLSLPSALAAYYLSIGVALIIPIFTNLGTLEAGGVAALIAIGVSREGAVGVMVLDRALIIAVAIALAAGAAILFSERLRHALRPKA